MNEACHASAPTGYKCADCTMDKDVCPVCYRVWWQRRHPNVNIVCADDTELIALQARVTELEAALTKAKDKLIVYREHSDGEYHGGMEHTALIRTIEATLKGKAGES